MQLSNRLDRRFELWVAAAREFQRPLDRYCRLHTHPLESFAVNQHIAHGTIEDVSVVQTNGLAGHHGTGGRRTNDGTQWKPSRVPG